MHISLISLSCHLCPEAFVEMMETMEMIRRLSTVCGWQSSTEALQNRRHYCAASFQSRAIHGFGGRRHVLGLFRS